MRELNASSPVPLYRQLSDIIHEMIAEGHFKEREMLPSQRELCERYRVSTTTVRAALDMLVREGMIQKRQGKGSFVTALRSERAPSTFQWSQFLLESGAHLETRIVELGRVLASEEVTSLLGIVPDQLVIRLKRLRLVKEQPIEQETIMLTPGAGHERLLHCELSGRSLRTVLTEELGLDLNHVREIVWAEPARQDVAQALRIAIGTPVLRRNSITFDETDRPNMLRQSVYRWDRFRFVVEREAGLSETERDAGG